MPSAKKRKKVAKSKILVIVEVPRKCRKEPSKQKKKKKRLNGFTPPDQECV